MGYNPWGHKRVSHDLVTNRSLRECASLVVQLVKNPPTVQQIWVPSSGREDPLEKEKAIHSSVPVWKIPRTEETGGLQSMGSERVGHD